MYVIIEIFQTFYGLFHFVYLQARQSIQPVKSTKKTAVIPRRSQDVTDPR